MIALDITITNTEEPIGESHEPPANDSYSSQSSTIQDADPQKRIFRSSHEGEHHRDFGNTPIYFTKATRTYAFCATINSCNLGYDIGISTSVGDMIQSDMELSDTARDFFIGSLHLFSIFGALAAHSISDSYGRRKTFLVSAVSIIIGLSIMASSSSYRMLILGRVFNGFGVGCGLAIDPIFISEISPAKGRGEMVSWREIGLNIGIVLGLLPAIIPSTVVGVTEWRVLFALGCVLPGLMAVLVFFVIPESPRWLIMNNRRSEARALLRKLYNRRTNVDHVVDNIKESLLRDRLAIGNKSMGWDALLHPTPAVARMLVVAIGLAVAQQMVGIDAVQHYMPEVLTQAGINSGRLRVELMIMLSFAKIAFIVVGGKASDVGGRRRQLSVSLIGMTLSLLVLSIVFSCSSGMDPRVTVFALCLYLSFYSLGMGPSSSLIPAELFPTTIRAKAVSVVTCVNRIAATIMASSFFFKNQMSWTTFFLTFAVICVGVAVFVDKYLPETKGRSLEDITLHFAEITGDDAILRAECRVHEVHQPTSTPVETSSSDEPLVSLHAPLVRLI